MADQTADYFGEDNDSAKVRAAMVAGKQMQLDDILFELG